MKFGVSDDALICFLAAVVMIIHDFIYSVFCGGEYEWHGSKIDILGLTNPAFQSQAKMIHADFWNSDMEKHFPAARNFSDLKKTKN